MELKDGQHLEQADGTSWMAMYALNMMRIAMELAQYYQVYEDMAIKFLSIIFISPKPWKIWEKEQKDYGMKKMAFSMMFSSLETETVFL
jgi:purine-nucleoside phosphorylase